MVLQIVVVTQKRHDVYRTPNKAHVYLVSSPPGIHATPDVGDPASCRPPRQ
jgi:hypothetical protein